MKLCTRIEGVRERLWDGSLTLDAAAQLQHAFERRERERARQERGVRTSSAMLPNGSARQAPARSAQPKPPPEPEPRPGPMLDLSAQKALVEQAAGKSTRQVMQMLADVDPALAVPADRVRPLGSGRWELKAVIDGDCQRGLEQLKGLLSHVDPRMTLGQLVGRLVGEGLDRHDPGRPRRGRTRSAAAGAERPSATEGASDDGTASSPKRCAKQQDATSASKAQAASSHGAQSPAPRPAHPAGARSSTANGQPNADGRTNSASRRSDRTDGAGASASKTKRNSNRRATVASKRSSCAGSTGTSAPHAQRDSDGRAPTAKQASRSVHVSTSAPKKGTRAGRVIPTAVRRQVWQRDGGRCRYVDPRTGRRCASRHLLQVDHVVPYALGGGAEPGNLRILCFAHHRDRHAEPTSRRGPPA